MRAKWVNLLSGLLGLAVAPARGAEPTPAETEFFESKIRPVLTQSCYKCHSADAERIKGGFLLDTREGMLKGGESGPAVVPGDPEKSKLIVAIGYKDENLQMPPKEKLAPEVVADFEKWVKMGAPDPRVGKIGKVASAATNHWAFQPVKSKPAAKAKNRKWVKQPVDEYILADLEERHMEPVAPADKRTLIRRATYDLTGLPPTIEEINAFLADNSSNAFAMVVDRLLNSVAFGERWGRHWLDLARYSDSNGLEINTPFPNAYRYRDWVIASFNKDKPYNEFIREQIAGDLLPSTTIEDQHDKWVATGFLVIGPKAFNEPMREKLLADVVDEQIDVTTKAFLGLTVACARCHDHKFDPIPTRDYYALAGIFRSTVTLTDNARPFAGPNGPNPWSERPMGTKEQTEQAEKFQETLAKMQSDLQMVDNMTRDLPGGIDSKELPGIVMDNLEAEVIGNWGLSQGSTNYVNKNYLQDGNDGKGTKMVRFHPNIPKAGPYQIYLSYTPRENRATNVPVKITAGTNVVLKYLNEREVPTFNKAFTYLGLFDLIEGTNNVVEVSNEKTKGFVVVDAIQFLPLDNKMDMAMAPSMVPKMVAGKNRRDITFASNDRDDLDYKIQEFQSKAPPPLPVAMAVKDGQAQNAKIAIRGDIDRLGDEVPRGFISVIDRRPTKTSFAKDESGRLELADWIASPNNPLTARVYVNRVWQHLFGRGLVNTPDNFGLQGEAPSNPELLDFLATQFVEQGWSTKKLIRSIMLSSAYQMSAEYNAAAYTKDPDDRYIWRMSRRRLEAEPFHDAILALSGKMDDVHSGPPPMPNNANRPPVDGQVIIAASERRSVFAGTSRNNLDDLSLVFDFPDPHAPSGKRHITSAATQALFVMNSSFVIDHAKAWAERLTAISDLDDSGRIRRAFLEAFAREPKNTELLRSSAFLNEFTEAAAAKESETAARRLLAWQAFCQALIASAEFRYIN